MPKRRPNVEAIIESEMKRHNITSDMIPEEKETTPEEAVMAKKKSYRYFLLKTSGGFRCGRTHDNSCTPMCAHPCSHSWSSGQTWCIVDLKKKAILKPYYQKCKDHDAHKAIPLYGVKTVKKLAQWAVEKYLILTGKMEKIDQPSNRYRKTPAHRQDLCRMCKILGRRCC